MMWQQQQQLPQTEDWQKRLAEGMAQKEWKYGNSILAELPTEVVVEALLDLDKRDRVLRMLYLKLVVLAYLSLGAVVGYTYIMLSAAESQVQFRLVLTGAVLLIRLIPTIMLRYPGLAHTRWQRVGSELVRALEQCQNPSLIRRLVSERAKAEKIIRQTMDKSLIRIFTRMSGDAVFALPFSLRVELATLAEQRETPLDLAIVILLALTSARDGNIQPVLRRLSKDARSPRLREVAAECLREFSASP